MFVWLTLCLFFDCNPTKPLSAQSLGGGTAADSSDDDSVWWREMPQHQVQLPNAAGNLAGFTVTVSTTPYPSADTMAVSIRWNSTAGPSTAQRQWSLQLRPEPGEHFPPAGPLLIEFPLTVPQGATQMQWTRYAPKASFGRRYTVILLEDGRPLPDFEDKLGAPIGNLRGTSYAAIQQEVQTRAIWVLGDADEDNTETAESGTTLFDDGRLARWVSQVSDLTARPRQPGEIRQLMQLRRLTTGRSDILTVSLNELPNDWRGYQPLDWVVIHAADWRELRQSASDTAVALRHWICSGGTLIIRDATEAQVHPDSSGSTKPVPAGSTSTVNRSDAFRRTRSMVQAAASKASSQAGTIRNSWMQLANELENGLRNSTRSRSSAATGANPGGPASVQTSTGMMTKEEANRRLEFANLLLDFLAASLLRRGQAEAAEATSLESLGAGWILKVRPSQEGRPLEIMDWLLIDQLTGWRQSRLLRRGVDPIIGSPRFSQWLIPGVSQPPVYTFMGLLTLFVILVGPVFYRRTMQTGRGYLIFVIAPVLAAATTLAMIGYGVIADGFGAQARVRQLTWVDGATGNAFTRTHSTLFTGIRPRDGLQFPGDAEILLYPDSDQKTWLQHIDQRSDIRGRAFVSENVIRLSSKLMPSRQQKQFVMRRPRKDFGTIRQVDRKAEDPTQQKGLLIVSSMQYLLRSVVVRDRDGTYWFAAELPAGETVECTPMASSQASSTLGDLYRRQWLINDNMSSPSRYQNWRYIANDTSDLNQSVASEYDSGRPATLGIFEEQLRSRTQTGGGLPEGTFIGETDLTDDAVALDGAVVTDSIHYVMGDLR